MHQNVTELIDAIIKYKQKKITGEELEAATSKIVASDDYETMTLQFRQKVELLDMWDVNNLTIKDLEDCESYLTKWLDCTRQSECG